MMFSHACACQQQCLGRGGLACRGNNGANESGAFAGKHRFVHQGYQEFMSSITLVSQLSQPHTAFCILKPSNKENDCTL
jgi:hypothetical protein